MKISKDLKSILIVLSEQGKQTIDDLMVICKLPRENIVAAMKTACPADFVKRGKDEVTGLPNYQITDAGRGQLSAIKSVRVKKEAAAPATTQAPAATFTPDPDPQPAPTDKVCCNAAPIIAKTAIRDVSSLQAKLDEALRENATCQARVVALETAVDATQRTIHSMELEAEQKGERVTSQAADIEAKARRIDALEAELLIKTGLSDQLKQEVERLRAENLALTTLEKDMPGFGAAYRTQKERQPRRPFSITGLAGYHAGSNKVTLFLDRRLSARSITLPAGKLAQLAEMAKEAA